MNTSTKVLLAIAAVATISATGIWGLWGRGGPTKPASAARVARNGAGTVGRQPRRSAQKPWITVSPRLIETLGVQVAVAKRRSIAQPIRTAATVEVDARAIRTINPRFRGWIEHLYVSADGDPVRTGEPLAKIYSPAVYDAEQDYVLALHLERDQQHRRLLRAARERLVLLGLSNSQISALTRTHVARASFLLVSPITGFVLHLGVRDGGRVQPGQAMFELAPLSKVWLNVFLYAKYLPWVRTGDSVEIYLPFHPGRRWTGRVAYVYPVLNSRTRTVEARVVVPNPNFALKPGMYADAVVFANPMRNVLSVPASSILQTGSGNFVIRSLGHGRFAPTQVRTGIGNSRYMQILAGLQPGERVVTSGQFLLDAESNFEDIKARMLGSVSTETNSRVSIQRRNRSFMSMGK